MQHKDEKKLWEDGDLAGKLKVWYFRKTVGFLDQVGTSPQRRPTDRKGNTFSRLHLLW